MKPKRRIITNGVLSAIVLRRVAPVSTLMGGRRWSDWRGLCFVLSDKLLVYLLGKNPARDSQRTLQDENNVFCFHFPVAGQNEGIEELRGIQAQNVCRTHLADHHNGQENDQPCPPLREPVPAILGL